MNLSCQMTGLSLSEVLREMATMQCVSIRSVMRLQQQGSKFRGER